MANTAGLQQRLDDIRGKAPRRSPTVRALAAFAQHTDCRLAGVALAAGVGLDRLLAGARTNPRPQTFAMYRRQSRAAAGHDVLDRLGRIAVPTHVVCGAEDVFTPRRYSEAIAAAIPGARLSVMPEVGHGMFWEATEAFNRLVVDFLREVSDAPGRATASGT